MNGFVGDEALFTFRRVERLIPWPRIGRRPSFFVRFVAIGSLKAIVQRLGSTANIYKLQGGGNESSVGNLGLASDFMPGAEPHHHQNENNVNELGFSSLDNGRSKCQPL